MMNRPEFLRGWLLLTSQPFGRQYRSDMVTGTSEPSPAKIQAELYYKHLHTAYPPAWMSVAELLASGDHWPSLAECREALRHAKEQPVSTHLTHDGATYMSREQFGVTLYDAVSTLGGILGLQDQIAGVIHRGEDKKLNDLKSRRDTLRATLAQQLPALTAADMGELLKRYPIVATL